MSMYPGNYTGAPPSSGSVAFKQGLFWGLILAVVALGIYAYDVFIIGSYKDFASEAEGGGRFVGSIFINMLILVVGLIFYAITGVLAARQTGKARTGALAGMWSGLIYGGLGFFFSVLLLLSYIVPAANAYYAIHGDSSSQDTVVGLAILLGFGDLFGWLFAVGLGALVGLVGGLIGRGSAPMARTVHVVMQPPPYIQEPYTSYPDTSNPYSNPYEERRQD